MKKIGVIIISVLLSVLLIFVTFDGVMSTEKQKKPVQTTKPQATITKEPEAIKTEGVLPTNTPEADSSEKENTTSIEYPNGLEEVDINSIPYTNKYITDDVRVSSKNVYTDGGQLYYQITFTTVDTSKKEETFKYFVSYSTYNSYALGDMLSIEYEHFGGRIISVNAIKKLSK